MYRQPGRIVRFTSRIAFTGLALALLGAGAAPLLGRDAVAADKFQTVTKTFSSTTDTISVSGLEQGQILDVNVMLKGFSTMNDADDFDFLLEHGDANLIVMSDAGGLNPASNLNLQFDDSASAELPDETALASGTFLPTNHLFTGADKFPAPAPTPSGNASLAVFNGQDPNGVWRFYFTADRFLSYGTIDSWEVQITARVPDGAGPRSRRDTGGSHVHHSGKGHGKHKGHGKGHSHGAHR